MGAVTFGIPKRLVTLIKEHFAIDTFVETGTFKGQTASWAAGLFSEVYTIENSEELFGLLEKTLNNYKNIHKIFGNSASELEEIDAEIKNPAIFWLDAHWCGGNTYGAIDPCPLLKEIMIIQQSELNHIILIDDARLFLKPPPEPQDPDYWPGIKEITILLNKRDNYYTFVCEDVIVSMPVSGKSALKSYFNKIHLTEFPRGGIISNLNFACRNIYNKWIS
jgi:hypothetical protein